MDNNKPHISVFGAGKMGNGIALLFACKNFGVTLWAFDENEAATAPKTMGEHLKLLVDNGIVDAACDPMANVDITTDFDRAAKAADIAIECVVEKMDVKQNFFVRLDGACKPEAVLCTNTSVMSITEIASKAAGKNRILGTHFWNPPFLIPLVEVVRTVDVADDAVEKVCAALTDAGKKPIVVKKDIPGFIANRMQNALGREAVSLIQNGICDAKDVDDAVKYSFGMRLGTCGPIEQIDLIGADLCQNIASYMYPFLDSSTEVFPVMKDLVDKNKLGFKTGGKGFQQWSTQEMQDFSDGMITDLIKVGKALNRF